MYTYMYICVCVCVRESLRVCVFEKAMNNFNLSMAIKISKRF